MRRARPLGLEAAVLTALALACASTPARDPARAPPAEGGSASVAPRAEAPPDRPAPAPVDGAPREAREREARPPAPDPAAGSAPAAGDAPPSTQAAVREAVAGAASSRGLPAYGARSALVAIAGMLERVTTGSPAAREPLSRMRRALDALEALRPVDLERADRVKAALEHGVEAIAAHASGARASWLRPWTDAAAAAVAALRAETPLGLQRAATQDALRALADAALVADQFAEREVGRAGDG